MIVHCMFEQSGTFKNQFKSLGIDAYDYDVLNVFNETDYKIDLFNEINKAYENKESVFDTIGEDDLIMAFFPCTRFEDQIKLWFRGDSYSQKNWSDIKKLEYNLKIHKELSELYELVTKLVIVCLNKKLKLIIENPYSSQHYLTNYWSIKPSVIDKNRKDMGDYFKKTTQYFFVNCEPKDNKIEIKINKNQINLGTIDKPKNTINVSNKILRSMISDEYANNFIRKYIIEEYEEL